MPCLILARGCLQFNRGHEKFTGENQGKTLLQRRRGGCGEGRDVDSAPGAQHLFHSGIDLAQQILDRIGADGGGVVGH